jgi:predicted TIM-barrel fold metal-dependent hydrolase
MKPQHTRRQFLRNTSLMAAATQLSQAAEQPQWIDAHVHVWTPDVKRYPLADGKGAEQMQPASFTPEQLFAHCKPEGVERIVLIQMSFYQFDNSYMTDMIAAHPGVFRGVGIVDDSQASAPATMKQLAKAGCRGFRLYTNKEKAEAWIGSDIMHAMWETAADEGLAMCLLADPESLPAVQRMCARHPKTRVVIDHFARIGMKGAMAKEDLDQLCRLADHAHSYVKTSAFYALGAKAEPYLDLAPMIRRLRDVYGSQRLMWASDCPFQVDPGHSYKGSISLIRDKLDFLSAAEKADMLRGTAEKVFFA